MVCPCRHPQADEHGQRPQRYGIGPRHQIPPALPFLIMPPPQPPPPLCCRCCGRGRAGFCARKRTPPESPDPRGFCFVACFAASAMFRESTRAREREIGTRMRRMPSVSRPIFFLCHGACMHCHHDTQSLCCSPPAANSPGTLRRRLAPLHHL
jgi:hypothetical protein